MAGYLWVLLNAVTVSRLEYYVVVAVLVVHALLVFVPHNSDTVPLAAAREKIGAIGSLKFVR